METNLKSFLGEFHGKIECMDRYGFVVCQTLIESNDLDKIDATRDWISNGVDLPPNIKDFPVTNIYIREGEKIRYIVIVFWGDIESV